MTEIYLPPGTLAAWKRAIELDRVDEWCRVAEYIGDVWANLASVTPNSEMVGNLRLLSDVALERAKMILDNEYGNDIAA